MIVKHPNFRNVEVKNVHLKIDENGKTGKGEQKWWQGRGGVILDKSV